VKVAQAIGVCRCKQHVLIMWLSRNSALLPLDRMRVKRDVGTIEPQNFLGRLSAKKFPLFGATAW
jgi:hypothetical protein